eukprot:403364716
MIIKGSKAPVVVNSNHNRATSLNGTAAGASKYISEQTTGQPRHYPGLLPKINNQIKMAQIFDNSFALANGGISGFAGKSGDNSGMGLYSTTDNNNNYNNYRRSQSPSKNVGVGQSQVSLGNAQVNQGQSYGGVINKNITEEAIETHYNITDTADITNGNYQNQAINLPQPIQLNQSNHSILLNHFSYNNSTQNQNQNNYYSGVQGIGPNGIELTSFFSSNNNKNIIVPLDSTYHNSTTNNMLLNDTQSLTSPLNALNIQLQDTGNLQESSTQQQLNQEREMIQDMLNQANNLQFSQNQTISTKNGNNSNGLTQNGGFDITPDNTQYTILKAKLFQPNIKDEGITAMSTKIILNSGNNSNQQQLQYGSNLLNQGKYVSGGSLINDSQMFSPTKHNQQNSLIQSQQYHFQNNSIHSNSMGMNSSINQGNMNQSQIYGQAGIQKQQTMPSSYNKSGGENNVRTQKEKQHELAKSLRQKKDMQQVKFYQTLTNQLTSTQTAKNTSGNQLTQSIQTTGGSAVVGYTHLNTSVNTQIGRGSLNPTSTNAKAQIKARAAFSQQPMSRGTTRTGNKSFGGVGGNYQHIMIQSQYNMQQSEKTRQQLATAGNQIGQLNSSNIVSNASARPFTSNNPYDVNAKIQYAAGLKQNQFITFQRQNQGSQGAGHGATESIDQQTEKRVETQLDENALSNNNMLNSTGFQQHDFQEQIILGGIGLNDLLQTQTQNTQHDKSYTQLLSDNSRENYMLLKSNMNSKEDFPINVVSQQINDQRKLDPTELVQQMQIQKHGRNQSIDNSLNAYGLDNKSTLVDPNSTKNQQLAKQEVGNSSNRKRQMISIEKVEKKRILSQSIDNNQDTNNSMTISNQPYKAHEGGHNQSMIVDETYGKLLLSQPNEKANTSIMNNQNLSSALSQIPNKFEQNTSYKPLQQPQKQQHDTISINLSQQNSKPVQNLIIKRCEFKNRPENQQIVKKQQQYYSMQRNSLRQMRQLKQLKELGKDLSMDNINQNELDVDYNGGTVDLFKAESQVVLRESFAAKQNKLEQVRKKDQENKHKACQRFLDRGNKPVPPNYEEHDVLPAIDLQGKYQSTGHYNSNSNVNLGTRSLKNKHQSRQMLSFGPRQLLGGIGGTISGLNLDEFDEEINGVNLGKLFSVYGPNSVEHKKNYQRRSTMGNNNNRDGRGSQDGRSSSLEKRRINQEALDTTFPQHNGQTNDQTDGRLGADQINNTFSDFDIKSKDDFSQEEPIVIRLMLSSMFTKKKSVKERMQMLPNISVDKLKKELLQYKMQERVKHTMQQREQFLQDRMKACEKLSQKFPASKPNDLDPQNPHIDIGQQIQAIIDADQLQKIRENPFYMALKANKDERERLKIMRKQQTLQQQDDQYQLERLAREEELKRKAQEKVQSEIFAHTFVDYNDNDQGDVVEQDQEYKGDIMNRPPKDVFTFMNLNFDLPTTYYQSFGDFNIPTEDQKTLLKNFMFSHWPQMRTKKVTFKVAFDQIKQVFNVILLGKNCPLSKCCKMTVNFQFDKQIFGGKVICMETLCPYNPIDQFFMEVDLIEQLYQGFGVQTTTHGLQNAIISGSMNNMMSGNITQSENHYQQEYSNKPRVQKALASEVSRSIQKGIYKNQSLREVLMTRQAQGNFANPLRRIPGQKQDMVVSHLFSSDGGGGLDDSSHYNGLLDDNEDTYYVDENNDNMHQAQDDTHDGIIQEEEYNDDGDKYQNYQNNQIDYLPIDQTD